jgi:CubicO group peptidase (beta-lactamase class C family)
VTHRSGAPANLDAGGLWGRLWSHRGSAVEARRLLLEGVVTKPPVSEPGSTYLYSNAGFAIAGAMAETVAKEPWEDLLRERLFDPLGMKSAGYGAPGTAGVLDQPRGHRKDGNAVLPGPGSDNPAAIGPAGIVHASIPDWAKFVALHLVGEGKSPRLLRRPTFTLLHAPAVEGKDRYAMGWGVQDRDWGGGRVLTHTGSNTMWYCVTWIAPKEDFAVLVACNQGGERAAKACDEAAGALIQDHLAARKAGGKRD